MKKSAFLALFIGANVGFVLLHLHKQSQFIHLSYTKQKIELETCTLVKQKQELTHQLYTLYDRARVLSFAKKELNMTQARVGQFKKITNPLAMTSLISVSELLTKETLILSQIDEQLPAPEIELACNDILSLENIEINQNPPLVVSQADQPTGIEYDTGT